MDTLHHPADITPDQAERFRIFREAVDEAAAERGLPPEPWN